MAYFFRRAAAGYCYLQTTPNTHWNPSRVPPISYDNELTFSYKRYPYTSQQRYHARLPKLPLSQYRQNLLGSETPILGSLTATVLLNKEYKAQNTERFRLGIFVGKTLSGFGTSRSRHYLLRLRYLLSQRNSTLSLRRIAFANSSEHLRAG
ncbi:hypothetical protein PAAG_05027 [Paracoccidioides lutzii Pb01]|uniref:Uncharacterized protein n=1 Tax=Paracoccidioides lutzii (strain ATCC MYA-826 / Pb01) TaxID=502779 RepID=C1H2N4_PARBA|nr:hypothetical protein PAAG_05027 [Paracoccidioides lutzii Pb01]EEH33978.2 hypothetical protein PAAG_05027 [Paracoccidioides lutzii Pb01]